MTTMNMHVLKAAIRWALGYGFSVEQLHDIVLDVDMDMKDVV